MGTTSFWTLPPPLSDSTGYVAADTRHHCSGSADFSSTGLDRYACSSACTALIRSSGVAAASPPAGSPASSSSSESARKLITSVSPFLLLHGGGCSPVWLPGRRTNSAVGSDPVVCSNKLRHSDVMRLIKKFIVTTQKVIFQLVPTNLAHTESCSRPMMRIIR